MDFTSSLENQSAKSSLRGTGQKRRSCHSYPVSSVQATALGRPWDQGDTGRQHCDSSATAHTPTRRAGQRSDCRTRSFWGGRPNRPARAPHPPHPAPNGTAQPPRPQEGLLRGGRGRPGRGSSPAAGGEAGCAQRPSVRTPGPARPAEGDAATAARRRQRDRLPAAKAAGKAGNEGGREPPASSAVTPRRTQTTPRAPAPRPPVTIATVGRVSGVEGETSSREMSAGGAERSGAVRTPPARGGPEGGRGFEGSGGRGGVSEWLRPFSLRACRGARSPTRVPSIPPWRR